MEKRFNHRYPGILFCLIIGLTLLVYWQVQTFNFINYDDDDYIYNNTHIQSGISLESVKWAFTSAYASNWHPVTWLSHMLDFQLFGLSPGWHHLTNLFFHLLNTIILFLVLKKITGATWQSLLVSTLFALHPLNVQSVAWVSERKNVLSTFFWLLTMASYYHYTKKPNVVRYFPILLFMAFGLMSKPMLVTLPCVLLLLDYWPLNRLVFRDSDGNSPNIKSNILIFIEKVPLFLLVTISCLVTFIVQRQGGSVQSFDIVPLNLRVANAIFSYLKYIEKMFFPFNLAIFYPYESLPGIIWWAIGALILILIISMFAFWQREKKPYILVGWLWYLGTLIPVIGIIQVGAQSMADRYAYIPLIGIFIIIAWGLSDLIRNSNHRKLWLPSIFIIIVSTYSLITWRQIGFWKNSKTIFEHTVNVTQDNPIAHFNLGVALASNGEINEAITHYQKSLELDPNQPEVYTNLGYIFSQKNDNKNALFHFKKAALIDPRNDQANYNLGTAFLKSKKLNKAIFYLEKSIDINPQNPQAQFNLGNALFQNNLLDQAVYHLKKAIELNPNHYNAHKIIGVILFQKGSMTQAEYHFKRVLELNPASAFAHNYIGLILLKKNMYYDALKEFKTALEFNPNNHEIQKNVRKLESEIIVSENEIIQDINNEPENPALYYRLGRFYQSQGIFEKAINQYKMVISLQPDNIEAMNSLLSIYLRQKNYNLAIRQLKKIIALQPGNPVHQYNAACIYARQGNYEDAIEWLTIAVKNGYHNWEKIKTDEDLDPIRDSELYKKLLNSNN